MPLWTLYFRLDFLNAIPVVGVIFCIASFCSALGLWIWCLPSVVTDDYCSTIWPWQVTYVTYWAAESLGFHSHGRCHYNCSRAYLLSELVFFLNCVLQSGSAVSSQSPRQLKQCMCLTNAYENPRCFQSLSNWVGNTVSLGFLSSLCAEEHFALFQMPCVF